MRTQLVLFLLKFLLSSSKFGPCSGVAAGIHFALPHTHKASLREIVYLTIRHPLANVAASVLRGVPIDASQIRLSMARTDLECSYESYEQIF